MEFGDRKHALIQQIPIGRAISGIPGPRGDEAIDEIKPLIIAHIDHHAAISVDGVMAAFMLEAAKGRALHRHRIRIIGIEFDNPAEAERLIRFFFDIETINVIWPGIGSLVADAIAAEAFGMRGLRDIATEIEVEVFLSRRHRAPGRITAGAIIQRAEHQSPGGVGLGLQQIMPGGGAGNPHRGRGGDAAIEAAFLGIAPAAIFLADFHHCKSMGHDFGLRLFGIDPLARSAAAAKPAPHQAGIGVFVVDHQKPMIAALAAQRQGQEIEVVIVIAELRGLRGGRGLARFESGRARQYGITPADDGLHLIAIRHGITLRQGARRFAEGQAGRATGERHRCLRLRLTREAHRERGERGGGTQQAAPAIASFDDLGDRGFGVGVAADVFNFVEGFEIIGLGGNVRHFFSPVPAGFVMCKDLGGQHRSRKR